MECQQCDRPPGRYWEYEKVDRYSTSNYIGTMRVAKREKQDKVMLHKLEAYDLKLECIQKVL